MKVSRDRFSGGDREGRFEETGERGWRVNDRPSFFSASLPGRLFRRRAFTLIELLVVIVLIGVVSAMMVPSLDSGMDAARARGQIDRITNMMGLCASMAATDAQPYRLEFVPEEGAFQITFEEAPLEQPGKFSPLRMSDMSAFKLDETMALTKWDIRGYDPDSGEAPYVEFRQDGTAEKAMLVFETASGEAWTITVQPTTSSVRVYDYDLKEREEGQ